MFQRLSVQWRSKVVSQLKLTTFQTVTTNYQGQSTTARVDYIMKCQRGYAQSAKKLLVKFKLREQKSSYVYIDILLCYSTDNGREDIPVSVAGAQRPSVRSSCAQNRENDKDHDSVFGKFV